jgi:cytochrome P450
VSHIQKALLVKNRPSGDLFVDIAKKYPGQDLISLNAIGNQIAVMNPRPMADLLVHKCYDFSKPKRITTFLRHVIGDGLILVEEGEHKFLRKNTMPAFHYRHIKELYPMMWAKGESLMKALKEDAEESQTSVIELNSWASKVTLDIIGIAGLGREFNAVEKGKDPLAAIYEEILDPNGEIMAFALLCMAIGRNVIAMVPWRMNIVFNRLTSSLNDICRPMIQEKKAAIAEKGDDHFDVLSLLMKSGLLTDEALKDQLLTFLAAGYNKPFILTRISKALLTEYRHETTASALTWACYLLTKYPEYQDKLREEINAALPEDVQSMPAVNLASTLEQLPLLNGIMHETLRIYPTVPTTMRQALRDTQIGDQFIPEGTAIVIPIWYINRSPELWGSDASEFKPERWIGENKKPNQNGGANSNYDFMTFLHGPRSCIGQSFAKAEMRCLLAAMVRSFTWELAMDDSKIVPCGVVTIKSEHGMYLKLSPLGEKG